MKFYTFLDNDRERIGAEVPGGKLVDLDAAAPSPAFASMLDLIDGGDRALDAVREIVAKPPEAALRDIAALRLAPAIRPRKLRGCSVFEMHLKQSSDGAARILASREADPEAAYLAIRKKFNLETIPPPGWSATPAYYLMDASCAAGHDDIVEWPSYSQWVDYELEIAAVVGKRGKDILRERVAEHIFGYTIVNDLSARDAQLAAMATGLGAAKGKDFDKSNPIGPCIVTADEIPDPYALDLEVRVNGETWSRSDGSTAQFKFDQCLAYASQSQTIEAGELMTTGTAPNCSALELQKMARRGDVIELEVEGIGVLRTKIA